MRRGQLVRRLFTVAVVFMLALIVGGAAGAQTPELRLSIDADPTNGAAPCEPVDAERTVPVGSTYQIAVCIESQPEAPQGVQIRVLYDGNLSRAPEVADVAPALDDNPDANAGSTTFPNAAGETLGDNWDCAPLQAVFPQGDDSNTPGQTDTVIACMSLLGPYDLKTTGALALVTLQATNPGTEKFSLASDTVISGSVSLSDIGSCGLSNPVVPCDGATVQVTGAEGAPPPATATQSVLQGSPTAEPGTSKAPGTPATPTTGQLPQGSAPGGEGNGSSFPWVVLAAVLGGVIVAAAILGSVAYLRWPGLRRR